MNPSASGWIPKFLARFKERDLLGAYFSEVDFYHQLKKTGFIYGVSIDSLSDEPLSDLKLTQEEYTKINLFHGLIYSFFAFRNDASYEHAINEIIHFYKSIEKGKTGFLHKLALTTSPTRDLEKILSARLQENNTILKNKATSLLTNALLYLDILNFRVFLQNPDRLRRASETLESALISSSLLALQSKERKNEYDLQLLELVASSSDFIYHRNQMNPIDALEGLQYIEVQDALEKQYLLDMGILAVWDDRELDNKEHQFLQQLAVTLQISKEEVEQSLRGLIDFSEKHATKIKLFEYTHPVKQFYKQSTATVKLLILRNKKRLLKELDESGELMVLLGQSTVRELTTEEKNKVKEQLLDICKTIPSLTIFLLPGGTLLLPLLVKFIPKLLPSAFHENRVDKE